MLVKNKGRCVMLCSISVLLLYRYFSLVSLLTCTNDYILLSCIVYEIYKFNKNNLMYGKETNTFKHYFTYLRKKITLHNTTDRTAFILRCFIFFWTKNQYIRNRSLNRIAFVWFRSVLNSILELAVWFVLI